jgi:hypothetical protein
MSLGDFIFDFDWDPDLAAELLRHRHLLVYEGQTLRYCGLILRRDPSPDGLTVGGRLPTWRLGVNKDGPLFRDKTWLSGANKLSNGDFSNGELYWQVSEGSTWSIDTDATVTGDLGKDDVLVSNDPGNREAVPGAQYRISATAARASGSIGHVRFRTVYEGRFDPPDLLAALASWTNESDAPGDLTVGSTTVSGGPVTRETRLLDSGWSDTSTTSGDTVDVGTWLTIGPCTQPQYIPDPSFENGLTDWVSSGDPAWSTITELSTDYGTLEPRTGSLMLEAFDAGGGTGALDHWLGPPTGPAVKPGERYSLSGYVVERSFTRGTAMLLIHPSHADSGINDNRQSTPLVAVNFQNATAPNFALNWRELQVEYTVPGDVSGILPFVYVTFQGNDDGTIYGGGFIFDDVTLSRVKGNLCQSAGTSFPVVPQDTYEITSQAVANPNMTDGEVVMAVTMTGTGMDPLTVKSNPVTPDDKSLIVMKATITPDDGYTDAYITFNGTDVTGDLVVCNYPVVTRTKGNTAVLTAPAIDVVPEKSYKLLVPVTADGACTAGDIRATVLFQGTGRPDQAVVSSTVDYQQKARTLLSFDVTPPSGYDSARASLVWTDALGGPILANAKPTLTLQDTSTHVVDVVTPATGSGTYTGTSSAPLGTEKVHVEIVAESLANGWSVDNLSIIRLGTTSTAAQVIADCLVDQDTGDQLFTPGVLNGSDTILSDFHAINLTNAEVLQAVARGGVALPEREWRYRPDNSFDFGTAEQLYTDRTDFTLRRDQLEVLQLPDVQETSEEQLTDVIVIGATQTAFNGRQYTITGSASVAPDTLDLDWNGQPIHRVRVVEDSTMDTIAAANAYAAYLLGRSNTRQSVQLSLSDWRGYADGAFDVGDWIYPYEPESGLVDDNNPVSVDGETIFPLKSRVLERTWKLGGGFSLKVRRPDGSLYDVPDDLVRWEADTSASVTVGALLPEFAVNPQGRSASDQFLRYRASTPS